MITKLIRKYRDYQNREFYYIHSRIDKMVSAERLRINDLIQRVERLENPSQNPETD